MPEIEYYASERHPKNHSIMPKIMLVFEHFYLQLMLEKCKPFPARKKKTNNLFL